MPGVKNSPPTLMIIVALVILTFAAFWQVNRNDFVNYDDPDYVTENLHFQDGLTAKSVKWAFTSSHSSNWHPLTWLSHLLDVELYGLQPAGHHRTNLIFHAANAVLLFLLLQQITAATWRSAVVAALFALHPLRVESVAWVSERKDVLSTLFWLLTLLAYVRYARKRPTPKAQGQVSYGLALLCFALGLMSKPMLVTLPFVLLLLDFWPLQRMAGIRCQVPGEDEENERGGKVARPVTSAGHSLLRLFQEKIPFFALTLIACGVTFWAQRQGGSVRTLTEFPLSLRLDNALVSYVRYIGKMFWPDELAVFYPHPAAWAGWQVLAAAAILAGISWGAVKWARRWPYVTVGWLWFLGTLVPVIGLVQVGIQAMADRYAYVPLIGLHWAVVWGVHALLFPKMRSALPVLAVVVLAGCFVVTRAQVERWRNSETLFRYALKVTRNNYTAHENLGIVLARQNHLEEAREHFLAGLAIYPEIADSHHNLGNSLIALGQLDEARQHYLKAVELKPDYASASMNLGLIAVRQGNMELARGYYAKVVELKPDDATARYNLGTALFELDRLDEAAVQYAAVRQLQLHHFPTLFQLGKIANRQGKRDEAIRYFREVLQIKADHGEAQAELRQLGVP